MNKEINELNIMQYEGKIIGTQDYDYSDTTW